MCNPNKKIKVIQVVTLIFLLFLYMLLSRKFNLRQILFDDKVRLSRAGGAFFAQNGDRLFERVNGNVERG